MLKKEEGNNITHTIQIKHNSFNRWQKMEDRYRLWKEGRNRILELQDDDYLKLIMIKVEAIKS